MATWRLAKPTDLGGLFRVANEVHTGLPESKEMFEERARLFPAGCLVLADSEDNIQGYAISHPIRHGQLPALDSLLGSIADDVDQYYIHDLAILPSWRGGGRATQCIEKLLAVAGRYRTTCLISVYGTGTFWGRFGFVPEPVNEALGKKLMGYGTDAVYLVRRNSDCEGAGGSGVQV